ncbi:Metallo-dependent phosphatase-like protein [Chaetomium sp. MPI-SDFR-AT-0129]|nr:Metallo-dependent phosphatase-like protein [Chaetomium sp. MPI-SDFR-AT-0129]
MSHIKTRFFILSDTHGKPWPDIPNTPVDVAIHCGDLTDESKLEEFRVSLALLRRINASLKLVVAGNHDFTLDTPAYEKKAAQANRLFSIDSALMTREYGSFGEARRLFDIGNNNDGDNDIVFLDEGVHHFDLQNGARLMVYASPFTPSLGAGWGFQYRRGEDPEFAIGDEVDVVITHGPPKGVLDLTASRQRGGCEQLFAAVARARPRLHCFGHIHEGWGAEAVAWRGETPSENPSHFTDIDNDASAVVETLSTLRPTKWDTPEMATEKKAALQTLNAQGYRYTSHCAHDKHPIQPTQATTLFVNASVQPASEEDSHHQLPWVVEIELPSTAVKA